VRIYQRYPCSSSAAKAGTTWGEGRSLRACQILIEDPNGHIKSKAPRQEENPKKGVDGKGVSTGGEWVKNSPYHEKDSKRNGIFMFF